MSVLTRGLMRALGAEVKGTGVGPTLSDWPWSTPPPASFLTAGVGGSIEQAVGLPAWLSVIRRIAHGAGMSPLIVYRGEREDRERAPDTWQWRLMHHAPGDRRVPFNLGGDAAACLAACGNAYLRKITVGAGDRRRVRELLVLDPRRCRPRRSATGTIVYDVTYAGGTTVMSAEEIIHVRDLQFGDSGLDADLEGVSPIGTLRVAVGTGRQRQAWERAYFSNDARPGSAVKFPQDLGEAEAKAFLDLWNASHRGPENAGKAAALGGGADLVTIPPISLADAQFVESERLTLQTIAGLYGMPPSLVGDTSEGGPTGEDAQIQFAVFCLGPVVTPLEQALSADPDLFPDDGEPMFVEALTDALVRPDMKTRVDAYRQYRQGGIYTANEIRRFDNQPPHPDGDVLQVTPVGGESNPGAGGGDGTGGTGSDDGSDSGTTGDDVGTRGAPTEAERVKIMADIALGLSRLGLANSYGLFNPDSLRHIAAAADPELIAEPPAAPAVPDATTPQEEGTDA